MFHVEKRKFRVCLYNIIQCSNNLIFGFKKWHVERKYELVFKYLSAILQSKINDLTLTNISFNSNTMFQLLIKIKINLKEFINLKCFYLIFISKQLQILL